MWGSKKEESAPGYPEDWGKRRAKVFRRDKWTCQACGRKGKKKGDAQLHAHHILPKSEGGGHELTNLITLCDRCHAEIHDDSRLLADNRKKRSFFGRLLPGRRSKSVESRNTRQRRKREIKKLKKEARYRKEHPPENHGTTLRGHLKVFVLTFWWTLGLGNIVYEWRRRSGKYRPIVLDRDIPEVDGDENRRDVNEIMKDIQRDLLKSGSEVSEIIEVHDRVREKPLTNADVKDIQRKLLRLGADSELIKELSESAERREKRPRLGKSSGKQGFWQKKVDKARNSKYDGCPYCGAHSLTTSWIKLDDGLKAKVVECSDCSTMYEETESGLTEVSNVEELDGARSAFLRELLG